MLKIDVHTHIGVDLLFYLGGGYPYALDLPCLINEGRRHGLERWVTFPMVTHTALSMRGIKQGRIESGPDCLETTPYAWENRRLLHEIHTLFPDLGKLTLPLLMVDPSRAQADQVTALKELTNQHPVYGLKIQPTILKSPILDLLGPGQSLLDFSAEKNLPILIHSSVHPDDPWSQVQDILQVARERPDIRFCLAHSCRFDRQGLDEVATLPNTWFDCSAHVIHCRLAHQNSPAIAPASRRFKSDYTNPAQVLADLAINYSDRLMWGSDAPFHSYISPHGDSSLNLTCTYEEEAAPLQQLSEEVQRRIAHTNILNFLGLKALP